MEIICEIELRTKEIEQILVQYLPKEEGYQKTVIEAMNYSFLAGGKRIRPMLMLETYRLFGGASDIVKPFMAAIEMIHTYSLIHDDLPAMDDDDYRRGRKTTHIVYGEAMAILAGDGLLNLAFETAAKSFDLEPCNPDIAKALQILARSAGIYGMIGGQAVDVQSEGKPLDREKLDFIYALKTGALIKAAMEIGAVLAGAGVDEQESVCLSASDIGLAFQIQDDILDVVGNEEVIGKPVGSDQKNDKTTYVTLKGISQASSDVEQLSERAARRLRELKGEDTFLCELFAFLMHREK